MIQGEAKLTTSGAKGRADLVGRTLTHYRITAAIGSGGMGEMYRATDTKLGRDVALKVLPQAFATDAERMARFRREAQVLASLNHPNIASIYGLEDSDSVQALVMELVEGATLADRIKAGLVPLDEALPLARQIGEALEYAHERGVIHRDLKPANVKVTPEGVVKVLDFGLAKAFNPQDSSGNLNQANSPTFSVVATEAGVILGTANYMSPEQAKGKTVDRRTDIWAFGCVLYEMLAGSRPFSGETVSETLAAVIKDEPDWSKLPGDTPAGIQRLIRRCLIKDPKQRLRDIGEVRLTIEETMNGDAGASGLGSGLRFPASSAEATKPAQRPALQRILPWALAAIATVAVVFAAVAAYLALRPKQTGPAVRFTISLPEKTSLAIFGGNMSLSPDGRTLAFVAVVAGGKPQIWMRPLDSVAAQPLPGTEWASWPFWSTDSQHIGFYAEGKLKTVAASGGPVQTLCDANSSSATWNRDGVILFSSEGRLYRVPEAGGASSVVASPEPARQETGFDMPQFLPDGEHFLFHISQPYQGNSPAQAGFIAAGSLGSTKTEHLLEANSGPLYAFPGYLFYVKGTTLMARGFDAKRLRFTSEATPVAENVVPQIYRTALAGFLPAAPFTASQTGVLAYQAGEARDRAEMTWFDRKGEKLGTLGQPGYYVNPVISPDGTRLAVQLQSDIWIYDLKRGAESRLTFGPGMNTNPVWSPDGSRVVFSSSLKGQLGVFQKAANGLGDTQEVFQSVQQAMYLDGLSPDGRYAICMNPSPKVTVWALPLFGDRKPFAYIQGSFVSSRGQFSPNGRYIAYTANETGPYEAYVQTFPQHLGKWQISTAGADEPMWRKDGKELFYLSPDDDVMSVEVKTDSDQFEAGLPKRLFQAQLLSGSGRNHYAVSPDGQRFLMMAPAGEAKPAPITVVVNYPALLKKQ